MPTAGTPSGRYNINNLEQTVGLFRGNLGKSKSNDDPSNAATSAPFILQISRGARTTPTSGSSKR